MRVPFKPMPGAQRPTPPTSTFRPRTTLYVCNECGREILVEQVDEGVLPMQLRCRATMFCAGSMISQGTAGSGRWPTWRARRATKKEIRGVDPEHRSHYREGGLWIERIPTRLMARGAGSTG